MLVTPEGKALEDGMEQDLAAFDPLVKQYLELGEKGICRSSKLVNEKMAPLVARIEDRYGTAQKPARPSCRIADRS